MLLPFLRSRRHAPAAGNDTRSSGERRPMARYWIGRCPPQRKLRINGHALASKLARTCRKGQGICDVESVQYSWTRRLAQVFTAPPGSGLYCTRVLGNERCARFELLCWRRPWRVPHPRAVIQASTCSCRISSGSAPPPSTTSWKAFSASASKRAPSAFCARARAARICSMPIV